MCERKGGAAIAHLDAGSAKRLTGLFIFAFAVAAVPD
jgi:hypothetical protein